MSFFHLEFEFFWKSVLKNKAWDRRDYDDCLYYYSKVRAIPATAAAAAI